MLLRNKGLLLRNKGKKCLTKNCILKFFRIFASTYILGLTKKMKHMKHFLTAVLLAAALPLTAQPIDRATALEKAQTLMNNKGITFHKEQELRRTAAYEVEPYYIFNGDKGQGFVIIGGTEGAPILGYSTTGHLDASRMAPALESLLADYGRRASLQEDVQIVSRATKATRLGDDIKWTESARWFQDSPFNDQCPKVTVYTDAQKQNVLAIDGQKLENVRSVTGCVATALAIVLYQNKYPTKTIAPIESRSNQVWEDSYTDQKGTQTTYTVFSDQAYPTGTVLEYDKMKKDYVKYDDKGAVVMSGYDPVIDATDEQKAAVAKLMNLCGGLMNMQYGSSAISGSSAANNDMMRGLWKYFGMESASIHRQDEYTLNEWQQMLYDELKAGNAVHYGGSSNDGGHAFVCDGYKFEDNTHLFHINWGWGPHSTNDGFYNIEVLAPINQAQPEKGSQMPGFTRMQNILRGLYPGAKAQPKELFCTKFSLDGERTIKLENGKISLPLLIKAANTSYPQFSTYLAAIVVDQQKQKHVIPFSDDPIDFPFTNILEYDAKNNYSINFDYQESYGKDFTMYLAYRNNPTEEWKQCRGDSECAFKVKDDKTVEPFDVSLYELKLTDSGVTGNTVTATSDKLQFTSRFKVENGSAHETMHGVLEFIVPKGAEQPEDIFTDNVFMVYADEGDVLDVRLTFDGKKVKPGSYKVYLYGNTSLKYSELFTLTVTDASDIHQVTDGLQQTAEGPAYDLQGRMVGDSYRGVVIRNGKKVVKSR